MSRGILKNGVKNDRELLRDHKVGGKSVSYKMRIRVSWKNVEFDGNKKYGSRAFLWGGRGMYGDVVARKYILEIGRIFELVY